MKNGWRPMESFPDGSDDDVLITSGTYVVIGCPIDGDRESWISDAMLIAWTPIAWQPLPPPEIE